MDRFLIFIHENKQLSTHINRDITFEGDDAALFSFAELTYINVSIIPHGIVGGDVPGEYSLEIVRRTTSDSSPPPR